MSSAMDDIDFDDLTSPKLTDIQRQILEFTEAKPVEFDVDRMLAEARDQANVGDLGDTDDFADRLAVHVAAIEADDGLTQLSRSTLRQRVVRLLRGVLAAGVRRERGSDSVRPPRPWPERLRILRGSSSLHLS